MRKWEGDDGEGGMLISLIRSADIASQAEILNISWPTAVRQKAMAISRHLGFRHSSSSRFTGKV